MDKTMKIFSLVDGRGFLPAAVFFTCHKKLAY
jgi:hypothetical protein